MTPRVEGPLLSLAAHGALQGTLTYRTRGARAKVGKYYTPTDPQSQAQLDHRARYLDAARLWRIMTDADRLDWTQQHQRAEQSAYNIWVQTVLKRETENHRWKNPFFYADADTLQNYIAILPMELMTGSTFEDISGNQHYWTPTNTTQEQGDRGQCALLTGSTASTILHGTASLGDFAALTLGIRLYSSSLQSSLGASVRLIGCFNYAQNDGFMLFLTSTQLRARIGDGVGTFDLNVNRLYTPNMWNTLIMTFCAADSGRIRLILNGEEIGNTTTAATKAADCSNPVYVGAAFGGLPFPGYLDNAIIYEGLTPSYRL
jgi:hypothetical protein